ncbi:hypothetical protein C0992_011297 [Termitomyces sp. T32_za158]|nr:hypothetical protein C0992_011297 [Termitomyces sp. T32_za158]
MDDASLSQLISELPEKCIALMEDIDAAFSHTVNREESHDETAPPGTSAQESSSRVSLSGLLNALDGVAAQEGRILFATTNKYDSLDPALCRPGRMDIHIEFKLASKYQAYELYQRFYLPESEAEQDSEKESAPSSADTTPLVDLDEILDSSKPSCTSTLPTITTEKAAMRGISHLERAPKLSRAKVMQLASHFSDAIPERKLSMANLQGYLMAYKVRPFDAVKDLPDWVEKELAKVPPEIKQGDS